MTIIVLCLWCFCNPRRSPENGICEEAFDRSTYALHLPYTCPTHVLHFIQMSSPCCIEFQYLGNTPPCHISWHVVHMELPEVMLARLCFFALESASSGSDGLASELRGIVQGIGSDRAVPSWETLSEPPSDGASGPSGIAFDIVDQLARGVGSGS